MVERRLQGRPAPLLQSSHQGIEVVGGAAAGQKILPATALHHPEMGPAGGELALLAARQDLADAQQFRQPLLRRRPGEGFLPLPGQADTAAATAEAFGQLPAIAAGLERQLHLGMAGVETGAQLLHRRAGGRGPQEQGAVQSFYQGALARLVRPADQGEPGRKGHLQVAVETHLAQMAVQQTHRELSRR